MIRTICKTFMGAACAILFIIIMLFYLISLTGCAQTTGEYQNYYIWEQMGVM